MIDLDKAKKAFKEYIEKYNTNDGQIALKIGHILRVTEKSKLIAESLNLSIEDIKLAQLIGLLHDIGRFEQVRLYHTFIDKDSINHGEYGVKILFEDKLINQFIEDRQYDSIIKKAILNHNRSRIEEGLNERELLHSKVVRDADKLDIFYVLLTDSIINTYGCENIENEKITSEIAEQFYNNHMINYQDRKTYADIFVSHIAYVFDFYFNSSLQQIKEADYLNRLLKKMNFKKEETKKVANEIVCYANKYIEKQLIKKG